MSASLLSRTKKGERLSSKERSDTASVSSGMARSTMSIMSCTICVGEAGGKTTDWD
jgi:hypothetical protein